MSHPVSLYLIVNDLVNEAVIVQLISHQLLSLHGITNHLRLDLNMAREAYQQYKSVVDQSQQITSLSQNIAAISCVVITIVAVANIVITPIANVVTVTIVTIRTRNLLSVSSTLLSHDMACSSANIPKIIISPQILNRLLIYNAVGEINTHRQP
ncbi:4274_t:CDS:2 [Ambispora leptoticha]|uniref:4274_t:CDS:1 n=1 Tax=Ambispora leptoticha TaxID=144679 RepID=A0A9N9FL81_9GLOM|nr:4274_t:CDS:2 [Ambispora leptoticha]